MIDRSHKLWVARQAKLLGFSRGSVYYLPRPVPDGDLALMRRIDQLSAAARTSESPRLAQEQAKYEAQGQGGLNRQIGITLLASSCLASWCCPTVNSLRLTQSVRLHFGADSHHSRPSLSP